MFHAIANANTGETITQPDSFLSVFFKDNEGKDAKAIGTALESSPDIEAAHVAGAEEGQSEVAPQANTNAHFIAFVRQNGRLWELDGRKSVPIDHGPCGQNAILEESARVAREFMKRDEGELRFTLLALAKAGEE